MSVLKAVQSLFTFNTQFLTSDQVETFVNSCLVLEESYNLEVIKILELAVEKCLTAFG